MCAFPVVYQGWGHSSYREWQDETDFPIKGLFQAHGTDSYRHAPAGPMVSGQLHSSVLRTDFSYDADTDTLSYQVRPAGVFMNIQLPGQGLVFHEAGQYRWSITEPPAVGPDPTRSSRFRGIYEFDVEARCESLAD